MAPKKILITSATGYQGSGAVRQCLQAGHQVYAFVRDSSSESAQRLAQEGATLLKGDLDDAESVQKALQGIDGVFFNPPGSPDFDAELQRAKNIVSAARASPTVSTFICSTAVKTGQHESFPGWGPDHPRYQYWMTKDAIESLIRGAGFRHWTILRPAFLLQNLAAPRAQFYLPGFAEDKIMRVAFDPEAKIPWLDARDVGVVAAAAFSQPDKYSGREIELAAEALTADEFAAKWSTVTGQSVKVYYYTEEETENLGPVGKAVTFSHRWASEIPFPGVTDASREHKFTSVEDFLEEHYKKGTL